MCCQWGSRRRQFPGGIGRNTEENGEQNCRHKRTNSPIFERDDVGSQIKSEDDTSCRHHDLKPRLTAGILPLWRLESPMRSRHLLRSDTATQRSAAYYLLASQA
jgi:hypothetical protein